MAFFIQSPIIIEKGIWAFKILSSIDFAKMNYEKNLFGLTRTTYPIILKNLGISSVGLSNTVAFWLSALMYLYKNYW